MANITTPFTLLNDMFETIASQGTQRAALANSALSSGLGFYQKKDYTRAASEFKRAIAMDPSNPQSYNFLANSFLAQKKPEEAVKVYKNSLALDPYQGSVRVNLGNVYLQQKKYNLAEKEFKEASKMDPSDTLAPYTLGQLYVQTERYGEAETQFKKVQRMAPFDPNPYYSLGLTYNKQKKYKEAVKELTQAVKLRPKMAPAHLELGVAYAALGDTLKAQNEVQTLTRLDPVQGELLRRTIAQPKMLAGGGGSNDNFFWQLLDDASELNSQGYYDLKDLDVVTLDNANATKEFRMTFYFDSEMDIGSVMDTNNWTITRASGGVAGYYNNMQYPSTDASIPQNPTSITYDSEEKSATIRFLVSQNATNNATIDPSRMIFKFSGKDIKGKTMDPTADQFAGVSLAPF